MLGLQRWQTWSQNQEANASVAVVASVCRSGARAVVLALPVASPVHAACGMAVGTDVDLGMAVATGLAVAVELAVAENMAVALRMAVAVGTAVALKMAVAGGTAVALRMAVAVACLPQPPPLGWPHPVLMSSTAAPARPTSEKQSQLQSRLPPSSRLVYPGRAQQR